MMMMIACLTVYAIWDGQLIRTTKHDAGFKRVYIKQLLLRKTLFGTMMIKINGLGRTYDCSSVLLYESHLYTATKGQIFVASSSSSWSPDDVEITTFFIPFNFIVTRRKNVYPLPLVSPVGKNKRFSPRVCAVLYCRILRMIYDWSRRDAVVDGSEKRRPRGFSHRGMHNSGSTLVGLSNEALFASNKIF